MEKKRKKVLATDHHWDFEDTKLPYFGFRIQDRIIKQYKTSDQVFIWAEFNRQIEKTFKMTLQELADTIGCSKASLIDNIKVIENVHNDTKLGGLFHNNGHQKKIVADYEDYSFRKIKSEALKVVKKLKKNLKRQNENQILKNIRLNTKNNKKLKLGRKALQIEEKKLKDIEKSKRPKKQTPLRKFTEKISLLIGTIFNHPEFGNGEILSTDDFKSLVSFKDFNKTIANSYIKLLL